VVHHRLHLVEFEENRDGEQLFGVFENALMEDKRALMMTILDYVQTVVS